MSEIKKVSVIIKPEIVDHDRNTNLHFCAANGQTEEIQKASFNRKNIDPRNYLGWTPLMMASKNGHLDTVQALLNFGANACLENRYGVSVFLLAVSSGNLKLVECLLEHLLTGGVSRRCIQEIISPLSLAILFRHQEVMQYLFNRNFDVNSFTPILKITPLMFAAAVEEPQMYDFLMQNSANFSFKNINNQTCEDIKKTKFREDISNSGNLTPAQLISQSPHMGPKFFNFCTPDAMPQTYPYLSPLLMPQITFTSPSPYPVAYAPQVFFGDDFQFHPVVHSAWNGQENFNMAMSPSIFAGNSPTIPIPSFMYSAM